MATGSTGWTRWIPTRDRVRRYAKRRWESRKLTRTKRAWRAVHPRSPSKIVAFVVGCQRSGTTMVGRILDRMMEVDHLPETDRRAFRAVRIRGGEVRRRLIDASDAHCIVFKPIADSQRLLDLMADHPGSKGIWIYRHYADVANSAVQMWGDHFWQVVNGIASGTGDWGWRAERVADDCLRVVRELVKPQLTPWDASAVFWYMRNRVYFDQAFDRHPAILPLKYEVLVRQPGEEFGRVCQFLGIELQADAVGSVHSRSVGKSQCRVQDEGVIRTCDEMLTRLDAAWERSRAGVAAPR